MKFIKKTMLLILCLLMSISIFTSCAEKQPPLNELEAPDIFTTGTETTDTKSSSTDTVKTEESSKIEETSETEETISVEETSETVDNNESYGTSESETPETDEPILQFNFDNDRWEISYDNGITWELTDIPPSYEYTEGLQFGTSEDGKTATISKYKGTDTEVKIPKMIDGKYVTEIGAYAFDGYSEITSIEIPDSVEIIGDCAFADCSGLTSITIPSSVKVIDASAFVNCSGLESVVISDGVEVISNTAFAECSSLENVIIPNSVKTIESCAFRNCTNLTSIEIPASVEKLESPIFNGCTGLENVSVDEDNPKYESNGNCIIDKAERTVIFGFEKSVIPDDESVYYIGTCAFSGCIDLVEIDIPDTIIGIGNSAFNGCERLERIKLSSNLIEIGSRAFENCVSLKSLDIPKNLGDIGNGALSGCTSLSRITVDAENPYYSSNGNCFLELSTGKLLMGFDDSVIPNDGSVKIITEYAFYEKKGLKSIHIPASVKTIENLAFVRCSGLESITVDSANKNYRAEDNCLIYYSRIILGCKNSVIPADERIIAIAEGAFWSCTGLESIVIPDNIETVDSSAFGGCNYVKSLYIGSSLKNYFVIWAGLDSIEVSPENPYFYSENNCLIEKSTKTLLKGSNNSIIPNGVTSIGGSAFYNCDMLSHVFIPNGVTNIGGSSFYDCDSLQTVYIPEGVTYIGTSAFESCDKLKNIALPSTLRSLGSKAFYECGSLETVVIGKAISSIGFGVFSECKNIQNIFYTGTSKEWYRIDGVYNVSIDNLYFYSEEEPEKSGKYWRYVNNTPKVW